MQARLERSLKAVGTATENFTGIENWRNLSPSVDVDLRQIIMALGVARLRVVKRIDLAPQASERYANQREKFINRY